MNRWVDEALPECAQWQRDLMDRELTKRESTIAALRREIETIKEDIRGACGCTDGEDIRNHLAEYLSCGG